MSRKTKKKKVGGAEQLFKAEVERVTLQVFEAVDEEISIELFRLRDERGIIPSCRRGCSACCRQRIPTPLPEAYTIAQHIRKTFNKNELADLKDRLATWFLWIKEDLPRYLNEDIDIDAAFYNYGLFCPLLLDGACSIYPVRPLVCRGHHVSSSHHVPACLLRMMLLLQMNQLYYVQCRQLA